MAEGAPAADNSSLNRKPATECVWDVKLFQNLVYASNLACVECGHPPKRCFEDKDHQTLCELHAEPLIQKGEKVKENPFADGMIAKAEIVCKNILFDPAKVDDEKKEEAKQCEWKKCVKDWQAHNDRDCEFTVVNCEDCCEFSASRSLQPAHHEICPFATIECPLKCSLKILRKDTEKHTKDECALTILPCSNDGCEESIIRRDHKAHVTQTCRKRIVQCPYGVCGCTQPNVKDESMEQHLKEFEIKHLQFQLRSLHDLIARKQQEPQQQQAELPKGIISMFGGGWDHIPDGWILCDGNNGTPDLREKFILKRNLNTVNDNHHEDTDDFEISEIDDDDDDDENTTNDVMPSYSMIWIMKC